VTLQSTPQSCKEADIAVCSRCHARARRLPGGRSICSCSFVPLLPPASGALARLRLRVPHPCAVQQGWGSLCLLSPLDLCFQSRASSGVRRYAAIDPFFPPLLPLPPLLPRSFCVSPDPVGAAEHSPGCKTLGLQLRAPLSIVSTRSMPPFALFHPRELSALFPSAACNGCTQENLSVTPTAQDLRAPPPLPPHLPLPHLPHPPHLPLPHAEPPVSEKRVKRPSGLLPSPP
jgi:hypothetical protein